MSNARGFKPLASITASDADLDAFAARKGVPALSHAETTTPMTVQAQAPLAIVKADQVFRRVTLDLPEYVVDQLHDRARSARCTTRHVIMTALKGAWCVHSRRRHDFRWTSPPLKSPLNNQISAMRI